MTRLLLLSLLAILLWACPSGPTAADCDYESFRVKAEVVAIEPNASNGQYRIVMEFTGSSLGDKQQLLDELLKMETDTAFLTANRIYVGNKYFVDVSERIAGPCDSLFVSFDHAFKTGTEQ